MGIIKCPQCGKEISDKSEVCIGCGYKINPYNTHIPNTTLPNNKGLFERIILFFKDGTMISKFNSKIAKKIYGTSIVVCDFLLLIAVIFGLPLLDDYTYYIGSWKLPLIIVVCLVSSAFIIRYCMMGFSIIVENNYRNIKDSFK